MRLINSLKKNGRNLALAGLIGLASTGCENMAPEDRQALGVLLYGVGGARGNAGTSLGNTAQFAGNTMVRSGISREQGIEAERLRQQQYIQPSARVERMVEDFFYRKDDQPGLLIKVGFTAEGVRGDNLAPIAYFYMNGEKLIDKKDGDFRTEEGQISSKGEKCNAIYDITQFRDAEIFIPYGEFDLTGFGRLNLKYRINIFDETAGRFIGTSFFKGIYLNRTPPAK
jgi:hypothetical protein